MYMVYGAIANEFHVEATHYTLIHFWLGTQNSNTNLHNKQSFFYMNIRFDKLLSEIDNVLKKKESLT